MNTEKTHYRTIPEEEYQELKALAEGNERAIRKIMSDSLFYKELDILKDKVHDTKYAIKDMMFWFDGVIDILKKEEALNRSTLLGVYITRILDLKEKLK